MQISRAPLGFALDRSLDSARGRPPRVGDLVRVRRHRWRVVDVRSYDGCELLTLSGIDALNLGAERRVIAPFDVVEPVERPVRPRLVRPRRWRRVCRALVADDGPAGVLRTARLARIDLLPHQLEPALAVVRGLGSRVLIADEVGLGKTIQAGLIGSELIARGAADRVLILTPAGLREQWAGELADRFGIDAAIVDMPNARRRAALLPVGLNPWSTVPIAIASVDYVKRPEVLPAVRSCRWDVVVVDEAHGMTPGSDRHDAVAELCGRAPYVLLLTATPHNGDRRAFLSLCGLGNRGDDSLLVFRRSRHETLGARRHIHRLQVRPSADEMRMHASLSRFTRAVREERGERDRDAWLALTCLHKRALSSARSLELSVLRRLSVLSTQTEGGFQQLALPLNDAGGELDPADEPWEWATVGLDDVANERRLLLGVAEAARVAAAHETKLAALDRLLARMSEPAVVFTEYRDTLLHVRDRLALDSAFLAILHGGLTRDQRRAALDDFSSGRRRILLATDAAGEGLNLHHTCRAVINLELPWNPMRLEQRIGRVDRIGQQRMVHAFHLIARDTGETRILERLQARITRAREDIGAADPLGSMQGDQGDDEEAVARLVIDGAQAEQALAPQPPVADDASGESTAGAPRVVLRLAGEAASECARLAQARALAEPNGDKGSLLTSGSGPALAFTRQRATRCQLASQVLVVMQTVIEDASGRAIASHLTPLTVRLSRRISRSAARAGISEMMRSLQLLAWEAIDPALSEWKQETVRVHRAFWSTRLTREIAITLALSGATDDRFQPGLFNRRAEHDHLVRGGHEQSLRDDAAHYVAAAERAAFFHLKETRAVLVLLP